MFKMESHESGFAPHNFVFDGYTDEQVLYHVWLLGDAGLMQVSDVTSLSSKSPQALPVKLTWAGHDFLDAARNDTVWSQALEKVKSVGGSVTFALFKQILEALLKNQLGL